MARGRRHVRLLFVPALRAAAGLAAVLVLQGASCLDILDPDPTPPEAVACCVVCTDGAPCGDACVGADAGACEVDPGCACAAVPPADSPCADACTVEDQCGFRPLVECIGKSCKTDGARTIDEGDDCLTAATDCAAAAACACPGGCAKLDECAGSEDATCADTCTTLVGQEPEDTFRENRCKIESSCADLALCSQSE
jgi:hypothetical protein